MDVWMDECMMDDGFVGRFYAGAPFRMHALFFRSSSSMSLPPVVLFSPALEAVLLFFFGHFLRRGTAHKRCNMTSLDGIQSARVEALVYSYDGIDGDDDATSENQRRAVRALGTCIYASFGRPIVERLLVSMSEVFHLVFVLIRYGRARAPGWQNGLYGGWVFVSALVGVLARGGLIDWYRVLGFFFGIGGEARGSGRKLAC